MLLICGDDGGKLTRLLSLARHTALYLQIEHRRNCYESERIPDTRTSNTARKHGYLCGDVLPAARKLPVLQVGYGLNCSLVCLRDNFRIDSSVAIVVVRVSDGCSSLGSSCPSG